MLSKTRLKISPLQKGDYTPYVYSFPKEVNPLTRENSWWAEQGLNL
jgi:hypothetical protein